MYFTINVVTGIMLYISRIQSNNTILFFWGWIFNHPILVCWCTNEYWALHIYAWSTYMLNVSGLSIIKLLHVCICYIMNSTWISAMVTSTACSAYELNAWLHLKPWCSFYNYHSVLIFLNAPKILQLCLVKWSLLNVPIIC